MVKHMRVFRLAAVLVVLTSPAFAQALPGLGLPLGGGVPSLSPEEKEAQEIRDKAYKESLKKIPNQTAPNDPWGSARAAESQKAAAPKPKPAVTTAPAQKKSGVANN